MQSTCWISRACAVHMCACTDDISFKKDFWYKRRAIRRAIRCCTVLCIMPDPTPTTPTNFRTAQELQFQHADCTSKVHKKCPAVLYASSFFSHPHWPYITACCLHSTPSSSVTAVAVYTSSVQSMKFTRHLISNSSLGVTVVILHHLLNIILTIISRPVPPFGTD